VESSGGLGEISGKENGGAGECSKLETPPNASPNVATSTCHKTRIVNNCGFPL
jgi:hypothetical protein